MNPIEILKASLGALGYTARSLFLGEGKKEFTQFSHPEVAHKLLLSSQSPLYPFASASMRLISKDKTSTYELATTFGISIPESVYIAADQTDFTEAEALLAKGKVIVKPAASSLSQGLTLNIESPEVLSTAIAHALEISERAIVQRQFEGEEVRFAVADGKVRAAILREAPAVIGDGQSSTRELIDKENDARRDITDTVVPYPMLEDPIVDLSRIDVAYVPRDGERIQLGRGTMIRDGASMYNIFETMDPSYIALVDAFASEFGPGFLVVDMMLEDYRQPATPDNYVLIETNMSPALQLFYSCRDGRHFDVGNDYLAPMIDKVLRGTYV